jgi:thiamine-phosphate pyrophosphorylase
LEAFATTLARAVEGSDVAAVRLRLPYANADEIRRAAAQLKPVVQKREIAFLLDAHANIAAEIEADGVHLGADDIPYGRARALVGPDAIVGVNCYGSRHIAMEAAEAGADYVGFGPFFASEAEIDLLSWWSELMTVPCVAEGDITPANCVPLVQAGADFLAVADAVWSHPDGPAAAIAEFNRAIADALERRQARDSRSVVSSN